MHWKPTDPIDFEASTARFTRWGVDLANVVENGAFYRVSSKGVAYAARQLDDGTIDLRTADPADEPEAVSDLKWRLGEALDRTPLAELAKSNQKVASLIVRYPGLRPPLQVDPFQSLITSITAQQVNLAWATTTRSRLIEAYGVPHHLSGTVVWQFPTPDALASVDPGTLRTLQFTTRKAEYIVGVAQATAAGALNGLAGLGNDEVIRSLTELRGIGRWSAEWLLARCLARPDVIAAGDLGVRKAVSYHYRGADELLSEEVVRDLATPWGDATNLVTHLLLETLNE
jgi:DNA-3-methyladenine glycosylase II